MELLCKRNVQDKYTGQNYRAGEVYEFEGERAEQVLKSVYFEIAEEPQIEPESTEPEPATEPEPEPPKQTETAKIVKPAKAKTGKKED